MFSGNEGKRSSLGHHVSKIPQALSGRGVLAHNQSFRGKIQLPSKTHFLLYRAFMRWLEGDLGTVRNISMSFYSNTLFVNIGLVEPPLFFRECFSVIWTILKSIMAIIRTLPAGDVSHPWVLYSMGTCFSSFWWIQKISLRWPLVGLFPTKVWEKTCSGKQEGNWDFRSVTTSNTTTTICHHVCLKNDI